MITKLLKRLVGELICSSRDGSVSLSRLAAVTAHFQTAVFFGYLTIKHGYVSELWLTYLGFATGHALYDKTLMVSKAGKAANPEPTP